MTSIPPLLLLPGMMCDARLFQPQIDALSGRVPLMTCPIGGHETMAGLAAAILANAPPRFALAGLSMGGIVAMEVLRQAPERIAGIALLDTNPMAERNEVKARRGPQIDVVRAGGLTGVMREQMMPNYFSPATRADAPRVGRLETLCMTMAKDLGAEVFINQSKALRDRRDQCDTLRSFDRPALVLCGRDDIPCPIDRHDLMHGLLPNSRLEIVENAGHLSTLEQPETTNAALLRWLEDL